MSAQQQHASDVQALAAATHIGNLHNKIAFITGGSNGLGRAIAIAYAAAGAYVVSGDISPNVVSTTGLAEQLKIDLSTPTADLINSQFRSGLAHAPRAAYIQCDVTNPLSIEGAIKATVETYGRLDIMVNNAGVASEQKYVGRETHQRIHEQDVECLDLNYSINVRGVWLGCKYAIAQMLKQSPHSSGDRGWVINMGSIGGMIGFPGSSCYIATKGAVVQMTKTVALEYARDRIHVNCINPGFAETSLLEPQRKIGEPAMSAVASLHPWGRLCYPEEVAKMAVFLAGDGASFCTGAQFVVDGGFTAQ